MADEAPEDKLTATVDELLELALPAETQYFLLGSISNETVTLAAVVGPKLQTLSALLIEELFVHDRQFTGLAT